MLVTFDPDDKTDTPDGLMSEFLLDICKVGIESKHPRLLSQSTWHLEKLAFQVWRRKMRRMRTCFNLEQPPWIWVAEPPESFEGALADINFSMDPKDSSVDSCGLQP